MSEEEKKLEKINTKIQKYLLSWMLILTVLWTVLIVFIFKKSSPFVTTISTTVSSNDSTTDSATDIIINEGAQSFLLGVINPEVLNGNYLIFLVFFVILSYVAYLWIDKIVSKNDGIVSYFLTLIPVALLGVFISTTGGLLNSPFSLATGAYLTSVLLITEESASRKRRSILLISFVFILIYPYIYLHYFHEILDVFEWSQNYSVTSIRVVVTIILVIITGIFSHRVAQIENEKNSSN